MRHSAAMSQIWVQRHKLIPVTYSNRWHIHIAFVDVLNVSHMDRPEVRQYINYLHDRFVIVPVDKASNNFGIVCKSFYLDVIKNELDISDDGNIIGNTVYKPIYQKVNDIYTFH